MIKLCENGMTETIFIPSRWDNETRKLMIINPLILSDKPKINNHELLIYEDHKTNHSLILTKSAINILNEINTIKFEFATSIPDTPAEIETREFNITNVNDAIEVFYNYVRYLVSLSIPSQNTSFINNMPTINQVYINDKPSDLFNLIIQGINGELRDADQIIIYKKGEYKFISNNETVKNKHIRNRYIRVNSYLPLYYIATKETYKLLKLLDSIELDLKWFSKENKDYLDKVYEPNKEEFVYSGPNMNSILTMNAYSEILLDYCINKLREINKDYFLIMSLKGIFKSSEKIKIKGIKTLIYYDKIDTKSKGFSLCNASFLHNLYSAVFGYDPFEV